MIGRPLITFQKIYILFHLALLHKIMGIPLRTFYVNIPWGAMTYITCVLFELFANASHCRVHWIDAQDI